MRPNGKKASTATGPARVEFQVRFTEGARVPRRSGGTTPVEARAESPASASPFPESRPPKIALLLALGHYFERLVRDGVVKDYAEIARMTGLTPARITQIVNLTLLAPEIQQGILMFPHEASELVERRMRDLIGHRSWEQSGAWLNLELGTCPKLSRTPTR